MNCYRLSNSFSKLELYQEVLKMKALQVFQNGKDVQTCQDTPSVTSVGSGTRPSISYGQKISFKFKRQHF